MRCLVCDSTDKWENVDGYRVKKEGMSICTNCGFVSYPDRYKTEEEIKEYYRGDEYRKPPTMANIYTGQRKIHYHQAFLKDTFEEWRKDGEEAPVIGEQGAAFGMVLNWFRMCFPKADVSGTELTLSYRRNAWHEYQVKLDEDFDTSKKYDLIMSYKVAEHQMDADKKIREMIECLKPDGLLYISVPTWFGTMSNFGVQGFDLEYYYSPDHINTWTKKLFETVLKKAGGEIVKHDGYLYDDTYLVKRNDELMSETPVYEDYKHIKKKMDKIKKCSECFNEQEYKKGLSHYPNFPHGFVIYYESLRAELHKQGIEAIELFIKNAMDCTEGDPIVIAMAGDIMMRYEKWEKAINYFNQYLDLRPNNSKIMESMGHCLRNLANKVTPKDRIKVLTEARNMCRHIKNISLEDEALAQNWVFVDNANIPTPHEGTV